MMFKVKIQYWVPSGSETFFQFTSDQPTPTRAINEAKQALRRNPSRKCHTMGKITCMPEKLISTLPWVEPMLYEGETVTIPRDPIVGRVRRCLADHIVDIVAPSGKTVYGVPTEVVERATGRRLAPREKVEYWVVYPSGHTYVQDHPIRSSSYDMETDLVRLKITKVGGKIVKKELL